MRHQFGEPGMRTANAVFDRGAIEVEPQRQCIDEQPHGAVATGAGMHAAEQHRAEHDALASAAPRHHLAPGEMAETGEAYSQTPRLNPQPSVERLRQRSPGFRHATAVAVHPVQTKRRGRFIDIRQHAAEKALVPGRSFRSPRLGHEISERIRSRQVMTTPGQYVPDFVMHHFQGGMIADQVMQQYQQQPAILAGIAGHRKAQQRRLAKINSVPSWIETPRKLFVRRAFAVQLDLGDDQRSLSPHHLRRGGQPLPFNRGAKNVVTIDHLPNGCEIAVEQIAVRKRHLADEQIGVALRCQQMVKQDAVLKRR